MKSLPTTIGLTVGLLAACPGAFAASMDALQGAWTMDGTDCAETFKTTNGKVEFIDRGSSLTTGIIVSGNTVTGPNAICTAARIRDEADHLSVHLDCADAIMFSGISVSFKILDADNFERFDPEFPEISVVYHKCSM